MSVAKINEHLSLTTKTPLTAGHSNAYGVYLQQQTGITNLVTGGCPFEGRPEADAMSETLTFDFQAQIIWIEDKSKHTAENASYSSARKAFIPHHEAI